MSDLRDFYKNSKLYICHVRVTQGAQSERVDTTASLRFNTNSNLLEYYTAQNGNPLTLHQLSQVFLLQM